MSGKSRGPYRSCTMFRTTSRLRHVDGREEAPAKARAPRTCRTENRIDVCATEVTEDTEQALTRHGDTDFKEKRQLSASSCLRVDLVRGRRPLRVSQHGSPTSLSTRPADPFARRDAPGRSTPRARRPRG